MIDHRSTEAKYNFQAIMAHLLLEGGLRFLQNSLDTTQGIPPPELYQNNTCTQEFPNGTVTAIECPGNDIDIVSVSIFLASGLGMVVVLFLVTFLTTLLFDRYCSFFTRGLIFDSYFDQTELPKRAGIYGLTIEQRKQILRHLFSERKMVYEGKNEDRSTKSDAKVEGDGVACTVTAIIPNVNGLSATEVDESNGGTNTTPVGETSPKQKDEDDKPINDADHERVCCICLNDYVNGCSLLKSNGCVHLFHHGCAMEWIVKHDHCPYCRKDMVSPNMFRDAANEVLGKDVVESMGLPYTVNEPVPSDIEMAETPQTSSDVTTEEAQNSGG